MKREPKRFFYPAHNKSFSVSEAVFWIRALKKIGNHPAARRWQRWLLATIRA